MKVADLVRALESIAPLAHAEEWDNVGLLAGDPDAPLTRALLCIDCTHAVVDEAVTLRCEAIVAYHPPLFRPISRVTRGSVVYEIVRRGLSVYSPHTALDAAPGGTNDALADAVGMTSERAPIRETLPKDAEHKRGMGRIGALAPIERGALVAQIKERLRVGSVLVAGPAEGVVTRGAVCAGAAGDLLDAAIRQGAEVVVAGEVRHHDALRAAEAGVTVVCALHSNSERIALEPLRAMLAAALPELDLATSRVDRDPFSIV